MMKFLPILRNLNHLLFSGISEIPADIVGCIFFTLKVFLQSVKGTQRKKEEGREEAKKKKCSLSCILSQNTRPVM